MVGHKLGEFAPTRTFHGHSGDKKGKVSGPVVERLRPRLRRRAKPAAAPAKK